MNFSKTDQSFQRASDDELVRKALLQKMKITRSVLVWVFWGNVAFLLATAIFFFWQVAPILNGHFESFNPSFSIRSEFVFGAIGFSGLLGVFSVFGSIAADLRVKMLIMVGSFEQRIPHRTQSEQSPGW